jgi:NADH:ubiquinone oxidoreductase subunit C
MKKYVNISKFYFLTNFSKFVLQSTTYCFFFSFIFFFQKMLAKFLIYITLDKYSYIFASQEKFIVPLLYFLKKHFQTQFKTLVDLTAIDFYTQSYRFQINYIFLSMFFSIRLIIKIQLMTLHSFSSILSLYKSAGWMEREIWDLFGIWVKNHSDLRRILTDYNFFGHPLRKDFPLTGYYEVYYDEYYKTLVTLRLSLQQSFRVYNLKNNWMFF